MLKTWGCCCYCFESGCRNHIAVFCDLGSTFPSALMVSSQRSGVLEQFLLYASLLQDCRVLVVITAWHSGCLRTWPQPSLRLRPKPLPLPTPPVSSQALVQTLSSLRMALAFSCLRATGHVVLWARNTIPSLLFLSKSYSYFKAQPKYSLFCEAYLSFPRWNEQLPPRSSHCAGFALIFPHSTQADLIRVLYVLCWIVSS